MQLRAPGVLLYDRSTTSVIPAPGAAIKSASLQRIETAVPAENDALSLPAWLYHDAEFFAREKEAIFRNSWQLVCHLSDVPGAGDFHTFEIFGESVVVVRADDVAPARFLNVCAHRPAPL